MWENFNFKQKKKKKKWIIGGKKSQIGALWKAKSKNTRYKKSWSRYVKAQTHQEKLKLDVKKKDCLDIVKI